MCLLYFLMNLTALLVTGGSVPRAAIVKRFGVWEDSHKHICDCYGISFFSKDEQNTKLMGHLSRFKVEF